MRFAYAIGVLSLALAGSCKERTEPTSASSAVKPGQEELSAIKIAETFDIAGGKAKVFVARLPQGSKATMEVHVTQGPGVDVHVMDQPNYQLYAKRLRTFHELAELASVGTVEYKREAILPPGTWCIVAHAPGHGDKELETLFIDACGMALPGANVLGALKLASDLKKHDGSEAVSRVELKLRIAERPVPAVKAPPVEFDKTFEVEAHKEFIWTFTAANDAVPGRLSGVWTSAGKSRSIPGANDDTLVSFLIKGPNNENLVPIRDHQVTGNFSIQVTTPGIYSLIFNNAGIVRSSARHVTVKGTYQPE